MTSENITHKILNDSKRKAQPKLETVTVIGRRWFQRTYGNTYFTASIIVNGQPVAKLEERYGYGEQYLQEAFDWLEGAGYLTDREHHSNGSKEAPWQLAERLGFTLHYEAIDVERERDL